MAAHSNSNERQLFCANSIKTSSGRLSKKLKEDPVVIDNPIIVKF
tara:strand:+ start:2274 stop:2408 length:135 start_codon:yes stop_codon:yes gene_type:complete